MIRRLAALAAVAALAGCGSDRSTIERGGRVVGPNLTIYSSVPRPGEGLGRDLVDAEKLAIAQAGGRAGDFAINFVSISEGPLGRDAPVKVAAAAAEQVIRDPQAIAVIGTLRSDTAMTTVPLLNAAGILQVSLGAGYPGFTRPIAPGEPEHWFPSGHPTFAREVGDDVDQAGTLVRAAGKRVAIETEAGKVPEALADAVRTAAGDRLVGDPARADGIVYAGTDVRSAIGVAEALAREHPRARIVFPDELTRAGIASRLPRAVRRRSVFVTSAPPPDRTFADAFAAQFGRRPDPYAVLAYRAMRRVFEAIEAGGGRARLRHVTIERFLALPAPPTDFTARG
jgi:ABC-type branched-subunit amino acid transport system substrate-binding protein